VVTTAANVQDRDGARPLPWNLHRARTKIVLIWADAGYAAGKLAVWAAVMKMTTQVMPKRDRHVFKILPRRWVVERTFAWISKHRRTVRDYEQLPASHEAMIIWAMIALMTRRLTPPGQSSDAHLVPLARDDPRPGCGLAGDRWSIGQVRACRRRCRPG
jgi:transposase